MDNILHLLIKKAQNGDKYSMLELIKKFEPLIKKYSRLLGYDDSNSDLLLAFIETIHKIPINNELLQNDKYITSYIWRSIKNKYIYLSKQYNNICNRETELYLDICIEYVKFSLEDNIYLEQILNKLTSNEKNILILRYIKDYSDNQIANKLNITRQAVSKTRKKALNKLKTYI